MVNRVCYFKSTPNLATESYVATQITGVTTELAGKASASDLADLETVVNGKADSSAVAGLASVAYVDDEVATLNTAIGAKANASDLTALETTVAGKASSASVTALATEVAGKASASDLSDLSAGLAGKVDQSVYDARVSNENDLFEALADGLFIESVAGSNAEFDYEGKGLKNPA
jgi:hypothetical protein